MIRRYYGPTGRIYTVENGRPDWIDTYGNPAPLWIAEGADGAYAESHSFNEVMTELRKQTGELTRMEDK